VTGGALVAVLASPPTTSGRRTLAQISVAADLLGCESVTIANVFGLPTPTVVEISEGGSVSEGWALARHGLAAALESADVLLAAWGVSRPVGPARVMWDEQVAWFAVRARERGLADAWTVGDARHPSRWHQYVSDRHGRAGGGGHRERLDRVLVLRPLAGLIRAGPSRRSPDLAG
jgi:hypothetical protein